MRKLLITISIIGGSLLLGACRKDFVKINTDPNTATSLNPQYLLSTVLVNSAYTYQDDAYMDKPGEAGRYFTKVRNEADDLFGWSSVTWDGYYNTLSLNYQLYNFAKTQHQGQYMAVSEILRAFNFSRITDLYGDCPYSEALQLKENANVHPRYDAQQDIYTDLLKRLTAANDSLANATLDVDKTYDIMYGGNLLKWRKFANALHLRLLMRISSKDKTAFTQMQDMLNDASRFPLFTTFEEEACIPYLGKTKSDSWPGGNLVNSVTETQKYKPSKELVDALLSLNDPRLPVWIAPVEQATGYTVDGNKYVGVPNAIPAPYDYNGGEAHISELAPLFFSNADPLLKASLMTYAEQCFILAEAAQQGGVTVKGETAQTLYEKGIRGSMGAYKIDGAAQDSYLKQPGVAYDGTLKQLIQQKWIAGFMKGFEGWFDNRRTGLPAFTLGPLSALRTIPARYLYPTLETSLNADNYNKAVATQGADKTTTLMWYLKK
ncbi:SusD/RagB family nutrient-binding outer membrane lipoprotein [Chitinophaga parva]|uniref:SusD/RagB family nutrient-binding outer membrane lipoprotein n=1 Tax=Chitinophaga parva TaxID=2169414 RepID=A0A2T7BJ97_9BACT|nr:SusD/RagB family nutrient-binding outer membrane lipoprotein [Chitinophaga parva]PUZ26334.1 SusD/RagB family nutrient-binding outer membrane lipoprotein [Chitinophaga parva]